MSTSSPAHQDAVSIDRASSQLSHGDIATLNRLANACRNAAAVVDEAVRLTVDPAFRAWMLELLQTHQQTVEQLERLLHETSSAVTPRRSLRSWLRRFWMRISDMISVGSPLVLLEVCRSEEYRVQAAYELALWILAPGPERELVEDRFQQFLLHRSMIPARRLPQTRHFLRQAKRLQEIHSPRSDMDSDSRPQADTRDPVTGPLPGRLAPAVNPHGSRYVPGH